jgi:hypothetical protein
MWLMHFADEDQPIRKPAVPRPQPMAPPAAQAEMLEEEQGPTVGDEVNTMLILLLPWAISVLLHLGLVLMAFFVVWSYQKGLDEETVIPKSEIVEIEPDQVLTDTPDVEIDVNAKPIDKVETQEPLKKTDPLGAMNTDTNVNLALIGVAGPNALPFGAKIGSDFFGVGTGGGGGSARTICYVVDASGSLLDTLPFVINELKQSIRKLDGRSQKFTIIFFQRDMAIEVPVPHKGLKIATAENVKRAADWITLTSNNIVPRGSSNPVEAIKLALGYKPDLIYILSDNITGKGRYAVDQADLLELIEDTKKTKSAGRTKINTIQFLYPDPLGTLKMIAEQNGGVYKFVDESVVGL